jgi:hypothetical protein
LGEGVKFHYPVDRRLNSIEQGKGEVSTDQVLYSESCLVAK